MNDVDGIKLGFTMEPNSKAGMKFCFRVPPFLMSASPLHIQMP